MLSAIAARKAAQAARQSQEDGLFSVEQTPPTSSSPALISAESTPPTKLNSKRKSSSQTPRPAKKKRKEKEKQLRYFEEEAVEAAQQDVIIVDPNEDQGLLSDAEEAPDIVVPQRAWFPSGSANDSSDEEDGGEGPSTPLSLTLPRKEPLADEPAIISTFEPIPGQNIFNAGSAELDALGVTSDSEVMLIVFPAPETICLLGTYSFTVLSGAVKIAGVTLHASRTEHKVFAPRSSPLPILEAVASDSSVILGHLPANIQVVLQAPTTLLLLKELRTGVEGLGNVCKPFDGVFIASRLSKPAVISSLELPGAYMLSKQTRDIQAFELPFTWISSLPSKPSEPEPSVHFVKGPKNSGKSTFARTLMNTLLGRYQRVAYLDCDLGQSEFGSGGMVTLNVIDHPIFGPAFTHPTLPTRAHFIGDTSPRSSPSHYLDSIQSLLEFYRLDIQTPATTTSQDSEEEIHISEYIPLVINTMGWNKGLGADLTSKIQEMANPTHVYEFDSPVPETAWMSGPAPAPDPGAASYLPTNAKTFKLAPISPSVLTANWSAADHRAITLLSYFHAIFPKPQSDINELEQLTATSWNTALPLCACPPYEVDVKKALDRVMLTGAGAEDVVPSEVWRVLNGAVVGLVASEDGGVDTAETSSSLSSSDSAGSAKVPYVQGSPPPSPVTSRCHGLALVRSMSPSSALMHVLTPVPVRWLGESRVMVKGEMELPIWGMLDWRSEAGERVAGWEAGKVPYLQWGRGGGVGGERRKIRRNLMRRGQM